MKAYQFIRILCFDFFEEDGGSIYIKLLRLIKTDHDRLVDYSITELMICNVEVIEAGGSRAVIKFKLV